MAEAISVYDKLYPVIYDLTDLIPSVAALRDHYARRIMQFDNGGKIVEIGVGTGSIMGRLIEQGISRNRLVGIDNSDAMIGIARRKQPNIQILQLDPIVSGNLSDVEALNGVDMVYTANFLYQRGVCENLDTVFQQISGLLHVGGRFMLMEPREEYSVLKDTVMQSLASLPSYKYGYKGLLELMKSIPKLREIARIQPLIIPEKIPTLQEYIGIALKNSLTFIWSEDAPDGSVIAYFEKVE